MDLTEEEISKLKQAKQVLGKHTFNRQQVEFLLGRKLTDELWQAYETSESRKRKSTKDDKTYSNKHGDNLVLIDVLKELRSIGTQFIRSEFFGMAPCILLILPFFLILLNITPLLHTYSEHTTPHLHN